MLKVPKPSSCAQKTPVTPNRKTATNNSVSKITPTVQPSPIRMNCLRAKTHLSMFREKNNKDENGNLSTRTRKASTNSGVPSKPETIDRPKTKSHAVNKTHGTI